MKWTGSCIRSYQVGRIPYKTLKNEFTKPSVSSGRVVSNKWVTDMTKKSPLPPKGKGKKDHLICCLSSIQTATVL